MVLILGRPRRGRIRRSFPLKRPLALAQQHLFPFHDTGLQRFPVDIAPLSPVTTSSSST
jgi:hypothetical protein